MKSFLINIINLVLKWFGKRVTNYDAPAKPFQAGMSFLKELSNDPSWVIDVGCANGTPELTSVYPVGRYKYLLIDANPKFLPYMEEMKKNYPDHVAIENCFCGPSEGKTIIYADETGRKSSRYVNRPLSHEIEVNIKTLDFLSEKHKIEGTAFLKVDVEGAELDVLKGAVNVLKKCEIVVLETWINEDMDGSDRDFASIVQFMKQNNFVVFDFFGGHTFKNGVLRHVDTVFVKLNSVYRELR